jgi:hypothetical protein
MLSIYASTKYHDWLTDTIQKENRLDELVRIVDYLEERPVPSARNLVVRDDEIYPLLDWHDHLPPYLLSEKLPCTAEHLLGIIFARLNNYERVFHYLAGSNPNLNQELDVINRLMHGISVDPSDLVAEFDYFEEYRLMHNQAIVRHYGGDEQEAEQTKYFYLQALESAPSGEHRAFTARHFGTLLLDEGALEDATRVFQVGAQTAESEEGKASLKLALSQARMQQLTVPYDQDLLAQIKADLWFALEAFEKQERPLETAITLMEAGTIAHYDESWSEGLGYLSRATTLLDETPALLADAELRKGSLLYSWAQNGNPQFYRKAAESFQRAARIFTREEAPLIYADLQHRLGLVYAEVPDEAKKKGMWAAVSSTAFQEALTIYDKDKYPYEYATVCNHYGNALIKYPEAKLTDNVEKALYYYQEALDIRTADAQPMERCLTLMNYLEAQWHLGMPEDRFDPARYDKMVAAAQEVVALSPDPSLVSLAQQHQEKLEDLKLAYA